LCQTARNRKNYMKENTQHKLNKFDF
jgi:hypothetical protein